MRSSVKTIAFYLPQFHRIPENDEWWGEGFTEWVNVQKSTPLFPGHVQPEIPLDGKYYDLLDPDVQRWQAAIAKKYGVNGFCYYHYWFDGKLLLEKPMENMLEHADIDIPFCVCWANETWSRTWNGAESNILIAQNNSESMQGRKKHFDYLRPFFLDPRYIKIDNRPLFIVYKPQLFEKMNEMITEWNAYAKELGFDGICWVYQHYSAFVPKVKEIFDWGIEFEPFYTVNRIAKKSPDGFVSHIVRRLRSKIKEAVRRARKYPKRYRYEDIWNDITTREVEEKHALGAFSSWDNTPRMGRNGTVFAGASPEKFRTYFSKQIDRIQKHDIPQFIFVNAWNEWGEGAHLEPDKKNGYGYLEGIRSVMLPEDPDRQER